MSEQNNFGPLSTDYDTTRRGYPDEAYVYLKSLTNKEDPVTLDLGCGTGIATRELYKHGFRVTGADKDTEIIRVATSHNDGINYVVAPVDNLPFEDDHFDVVTTFTSFHWFANEQSVGHIKRVLKKDGVFFTALKDTRPEKNREVSKKIREIFEKYVGENWNSARNYEPRTLLEKCDFKKVEEKSFFSEERYTVDEAVQHIKSLSFWNLISDKERPNLLKELKEVYEQSAVNGFVLKHKVTNTVAGFNSKNG